MKRREFIKRSIPVTTIPMMIGGMPISAIAESENLKQMLSKELKNIHLESNIEDDSKSSIFKSKEYPIDSYPSW